MGAMKAIKKIFLLLEAGGFEKEASLLCEASLQGRRMRHALRFKAMW
jgi:hypothetical protein